MSDSSSGIEIAREARARLCHPRIHIHGSMAQLISEKDWSQTPLGAIDIWSETLVSSVNFMLGYPFSFALYWGPERVLLYNDQYRAHLYTKHPDALGRPGHEVWQEAWPVILTALEKAVGGIPTAETEVLIPIYVGEQLEDRWWTYGFYPIYDRGVIAGVANPAREDTSGVLAKIALRENQEQLSKVLEATRDVVTMIDRDWTYTYANPQANAAFGPDLVGKNVWEAFPQVVYEHSPFTEAAHKAMDEREPQHFEAILPFDESEMVLDIDLIPSGDGIIAFSRDVTEKKKTAAALLQNEKLAAVGRLASSVAHEINNPLEAVTNLIYLAKESQSRSETNEFLEIADRELRRIGAISSQTLRFHKQTTRPTAVSCTDLFGEALSIYQGRLVNSNIFVEKRKRAKNFVECFEGEIRQVLSNLISNAIDAMPHGGRLILRSRDSRNWKTGEEGLSLTVADTGTGISPATLKHIFDAFYTTKGIGGTGLGMWVSKEILDRHRGAIAVRSSTLAGHSGTVFSVFLPRAAVVRQGTA